ncbi:alpha/beta hydrolase [Paenibacillus roseipurpureus]|uniref:Alpha/beta fold hydrolase n=1 Tax=Paenibacillus roseopurpureus TaxID=2918901 RepID=A0AA96RKK2_9BACL|nr:alpha/beta fold hydrolase [Paenibacillus sp. MBLB1832]WNR44840.1 alpha/beta fold hydrolase [Paenibacillus sp. MBLB1832]
MQEKGMGLIEDRIYKSTEPFYWRGHGDNQETGILMIHGFTGSPSEFRRIGYTLREEGYTIQAVRLPGHGTSPEDMRRTGWTDWYGHVLESYDQLAANCKRVVIMGHSMGGLLALKLAGERAAAGVISLATPIFLHSRKSAWAVILQYFIPYIAKKPKKISTLLDESCAYTKTPIRCVVSLRKLMKQVKKALNRVEAPIWIGQGNKDGVVHPSSAAFLQDKVKSRVSELQFYKESTHGLLLDQERERIYADISAFILSLQVAYYGARELGTAD